MPFNPILKHSLSGEPWLLDEAYRSGKAVRIPSSTADEIKRRDYLTPLGSHWDLDDYAAETDCEEEDFDISTVMMAHMRDQMDLDLRKRRQEYQARVRKHTLDYFASKRSTQRSQRMYDIEVRLRCIKPVIWRRIRVPASMPLHALVDRVLLNAMPLGRGYHSNYLELPTAAYKDRVHPEYARDVIFTMERAGTIDVMHMPMLRGGHCRIPTEQVLLCDLLREEGDTFKWTYDIGDKLRHLVTLVAVHEGKDASSRKVVLLNGANAGIPEDPGSMRDHAQRLETLSKSKPSSMQHKETLSVIHRSCTADLLVPTSGVFDPTYFPKARLQGMIDSATAEAGGANYGGVMGGGAFQTMPGGAGAGHAFAGLGIPFNGALPLHKAGVSESSAGAGAGADDADEPYDLRTMMLKQYLAGMTRPLEGASVTAMSPVGAACGLKSCAKPLRSPQWCSQCRNVAYCGVDCQRGDWKAGHKLACIKKEKK